MIDFLHLQYFMTIAEYGNISKAAAALHISQPALSKTLAKLEDELGVQLFDRKGRKIVLNHYGQIVLKHAHAAFRSINNMQTELQSEKERETDTIMIGSVDPIYVQNWLPEFIESHPTIKIQHTIDSCYNLKRKLYHGTLDLAVLDCFSIQDDFDYHILGKDEYLVLSSLDNPISNAEPQDFSLFDGQPFLCLPKMENVLRPIDILCQATGITPNIVFEGGRDMHARLLLMGYGNVIVYRSQIITPESYKSCQQNHKIIHLTNPQAYFNVYLIWDGKRVMRPAIKQFLEFVQNETNQFHLITPSQSKPAIMYL